MTPDRNEQVQQNRLARGWTPSPRLRAFGLVAIGLLLLTHPLVGGLPSAVGLTGTAEYTAYEVSPAGDGFAYQPLAAETGELSAQARVSATGGLTLLDCYPFESSRACTVEAALTNRSLTVASPTDWSGYTYHDGFYERTAVSHDDGVELRLRSVSARAVLANISIPARDWTHQTRKAVEAGQISTSRRLPGAMLARNGSYYIVLPEGGDPPEDEQPGPLETVLSSAGGVLLLQRGIRDGE